MLIETKHFTIDTATHTIKAKQGEVTLTDMAVEINAALATNMLPPMIKIEGSTITLLPKVNFIGHGNKSYFFWRPLND
jgi:hypothetical protein